MNGDFGGASAADTFLNIGIQGLEAAMGRSESRGVVRSAADDLDVAR